MQNIDDAEGVEDLFTVDGGPDQKRWWNMRIHTHGTSPGSGQAVFNVNGNPTSLAVGVGPGADNQGHDHFLLTTGDVLTVEMTNGCVGDLVVSASVDEEDF